MLQSFIKYVKCKDTTRIRKTIVLVEEEKFLFEMY